MNDENALARACAAEHEYGGKANDFVAQRIEASLKEGDDQEVCVWVSVREMLIQLDRIACFSSAEKTIYDVASTSRGEELRGRYNASFEG